MKEKDIIATLVAGTGAFVFSNAIYNKFVLQKHHYPFGRAITISFIFLTLAYLINKVDTKGKGEEETSENNTVEYSGIIINPAEVRTTCHCEPICRIACFAKGAIGALSEEQIKKYCPEKYKEIEKLLKERKV